MKVITHDDEGFLIEQGSEAWKQIRVGLFTGTGIGDLLPGVRGGYGKSRVDQIDEVVTELLTGKPSGGWFATKYVKEGIEREPDARMAYQELTGHIVDQVAFIRHDWLRAGISPDGVIRGRKKNIEIKCPKDRTHLRYLQMTTCPEEYVNQVASQQWIGEFEETDFISFHPDFPPELQLHVITVPRMTKLVAQINDEVTRAHAEVNVLVKKFKEMAEGRKG